MTVHFARIAPLIFASVPMVLLIGNIMLANNICDADEDIVNKRYTLPISIGRVNSLRLYGINVTLAYTVVALSVILKLLPIGFLLSLCVLPKIYGQTRTFIANPQKSKTFKLSVKNFMMYSSMSLLGLFISYVWG